MPFIRTIRIEVTPGKNANDPNYKETPIIIITTEGASEDRERALALGANEYITKPIQTMKILETVKKLMNV